MKIACTTLGCPGWTLDEILQQLQANGYDGIDFRGLGEEMKVWLLPEFTTAVDETAEKIAQAGLEVSGFSSGARVYVTDDEARKNYLEEVVQYADLCRRFGTRIIRVFGGAFGDVPLDEAVDASVEALTALADAAGRDVVLAVETHDDWIRTAGLGELLARVDRPNVGVLWDLHHPFRMGGESPAETYANIGRYIVGTHVKDSRLTEDGKFEYCLAGEGDVPLAEMIGLLTAGGYDGYITLEWEKKWHPELPGAEVALPSYAQYLRKLTA